MKKSIWFWICFVIAVITAVYFATRIFMIVDGRGRLARIRTVSITADQTGKDLRPIAAATGVPPGAPTFKTDLDAVCARVAAVPGVRAAAVRRTGNGNLSIRVALHHTIAQWTDGDKFFPISTDGTIVQRPA
ncbi:hypothetical protein HDR63_03800, partial [bacterium]|nr:hypothetical protein [bacterium]